VLAYAPTAVATCVTAVLAAACGTGGGSDAERFCGEIGDDIAAVVTPSIASDEDLDATLSHYRMLADLAPAAIEPEWRDLVLNLETASTVVPQDPDSMQRAVAQAYATERSAVAVSEWLAANCSIDLGPVATITPQEPVVPRYDDLDDSDDSDDVGDPDEPDDPDE
jgi:hypothetical protein